MFDKVNVIVNAIIFFVYALVVLLNFQETFNFALTFIFSLVALLINIYISLNNNHENSFNQYPIIIATNLLYYIQLALSIIFVYLNSIPIKIALIIQVILIAIHLIIVILLLPSKHHIEKVEKRYSGYTTFFQNLKNDTDNLITKNNNPDLEEDLKELKELITYSDPTTSITVQDIDEMITENMKELKIKINDQPTEKSKELISVIRDEIEMRNTELKH